MKNLLFALKKNIIKTRNLVKASKRLLLEGSLTDHTPEKLLRLLTKYPEFMPSQKNTEISFLMDQVHDKKPKVICEIGSLKGGTLYLLSQAAPNDALLISIDINYPSERRLAYNHFIKEGQQLVCIEGDTQDPKTVSRVMKLLKERIIDFLFIDGDHSLFGVMNDYIRFQPLVRDGGVIAFHDINPDQFFRTGVKTSSYVGGVPHFWKFLSSQNLITEQFIEDPEQDGFGIGIIINEAGIIN